MVRPKQMSWAEIVGWSFLSGFVMLAFVAAIFTYVYFNDGATKVWFDGLSTRRFAAVCATPWVLTFWGVFVFLVKVRVVEDDTVAKVADFIDESWRK